MATYTRHWCINYDNLWCWICTVPSNLWNRLPPLREPSPNLQDFRFSRLWRFKSWSFGLRRHAVLWWGGGIPTLRRTMLPSVFRVSYHITIRCINPKEQDFNPEHLIHRIPKSHQVSRFMDDCSNNEVLCPIHTRRTWHRPQMNVIHLRRRCEWINR
jgi:hypothetical protein